MDIEYYTFNSSWNKELNTTLDSQNTLIIIFGSDNVEKIKKPLEEIKNKFTKSIIIGASTAGEIVMDELKEDSLVLTIVRFKTTRLKLSYKPISSLEDSYNIAKDIAQDLEDDMLQHIFVLSDGLHINGSQLADGFSQNIKKGTSVSGGLAGDNGKFQSTWIIVDGKAKENYTCGLGFYGENFYASYSFRGGWDIFGIQRKVTKSLNNTVYEIDNQPILDIYKKYLGEKAQELPASGLLFPLGVYDNENNIIVRTILAIDEETKSITFAGNILQGSNVCLMKSNNDRLIEAASASSKELSFEHYNGEPMLNIAISCIGRKLVLKQRVEEELEATLENLPQNTVQIGFYSFGEISPSGLLGCDLHNQTMTLTSIWEKDA